MYSKKFVRLNDKFSDFYNHVPAPMFRRKFFCEKDKTKECIVSICAVGLYHLFINGKNITKGLLAPYLTDPDKLLYYDKYDITEDLFDGENVIGVVLGTGIRNDVGRWNWAFDKASFRGYVEYACSIEITGKDGGVIIIENDENVKAAESPIIFDSLYFGEQYDKRKEILGWNNVGFDDSEWKSAEYGEVPKGIPTESVAEPIKTRYKLSPVKISKQQDGFLYDFGENCAGLCTLKIKNSKCGQEIKLYYGEAMINGKFDDTNIVLTDPNPAAGFKAPYEEMRYVDVYFCKGEKEEVYTPYFTYHGFQYVLVNGITEEQARDDLLVYNVMSSDLPKTGNFICSDDCVNAIQKMVERSDLANFYYFPTDCPTREKNGWTGDASLSAEQMIINFDVEKSMEEWFKIVRAQQKPSGALSGYYPTPGWSKVYGDYPGPAWDSFLFEIPYKLYLYRGNSKIIEDNADAMFKYLKYIETRKNGDGLICYGFGDWVQAGVLDVSQPVDSPLEVTSTYYAIKNAEKAALMFNIAGKAEYALYAKKQANNFRKAFIDRLVGFDDMTVKGKCQTSQCMGIDLGIFKDGNEKDKAIDHLLGYVKQYDYHLHTGVLGGRLIFHTLFENGYHELAYKMITDTTFPSYGFFNKIGSTTMWEGFVDEKISLPYSRNHHFWGDVSHCFYRYLAGINVNPELKDYKNTDVKPYFISGLNYVNASYETPLGTLSVKWTKNENRAEIEIEKPKEYYGKLIAPPDYMFNDADVVKPLENGRYILVKKEI